MGKKSLSALLALTAAITAASCGSGTQQEDGQNRGETENTMSHVTLTIRHTQIKQSAKARLGILQDVLNQTERDNPQLKFQLEGIDEIINRDQKLKAEMATGSTPDIFEIFGGSDIKLYVKAGRLLDLTPIIHKLGIDGKFHSLDEFTVDGRVYGLPFGGYSEAVFYNKQIFRDLGLGIPVTWEQLMNVSEKIKQAGYSPFALSAKDPWLAGMMWNTIMDRYAGTDKLRLIVSGTAKWSDPDILAGFRAYAELVEKGYFPQDALGQEEKQQLKDLLSGKAAMLFTGTWDLAGLTGDEAGQYRHQIGYFSFPSVPGGKGDQGALNAGYSNGFGFSSDLSTEQQGMVERFIRNFFNENVQKRILLEDKTLPSMKLSDYTGIDPLISEVLQVAGNATRSFPAFDSIFSPRINAEIGIGLQQLIGGVKTAEQIVQRLQQLQDSEPAAADRDAQWENERGAE
ncbi:extracellular solute-binding protein [Paenibacillus pasadenensis]|uniref:extracellular solute-binding protein n=1 Tax=Paenibacillus pasadenensis TaxID=217090 RepID=UPI00203EB1A4|nr:extracellular solute-binding protein [Paenibacillus pasadenensis]MCM3746921.1 extracellular solute-binding protein [Paenibacillus pasadenensis]